MRRCRVRSIPKICHIKLLPIFKGLTFQDDGNKKIGYERRPYGELEHVSASEGVAIFALIYFMAHFKPPQSA